MTPINATLLTIALLSVSAVYLNRQIDNHFKNRKELFMKPINAERLLWAQVILIIGFCIHFFTLIF